MLTSKIIIIYRIIALLILSIPAVINVYSEEDIVSSIIYVPLITLGLSAIAIFIDGRLEELLNKDIALTKLSVSTDDIYLSNSAIPINVTNTAIGKSFIKSHSPDDEIIQLPSNSMLYKEVQLT